MQRAMVLLDAAPFCYGPISTLLAIVEHLSDDDLDLHLLASGTALEFASALDARFVIHHVNSEDTKDLERARPLFEQCRLFVSNTNPESVKFALAAGVKTVYVDTLFWMWDAIDPAVAGADLYLAQTFHGIEANHARLGAPIKNFAVVGPLIATRTAALRRENRIVISFGGMESSLTIPGQTNHYASVIGGLVASALQALPPFEETLFCGRGPVMAALARQLNGDGYRFGFLRHPEYLRALDTCRLALLSPGLTGAYEARARAVRAAFLLPQNYSQELQLRVFAKDPAWPFPGRTWQEIYPDLVLPPFLPEAEAIARLNDTILRFEEDRAAQRRYLEMLLEDLRGARVADPAPIRSGCIDATDRIRALL